MEKNYISAYQIYVSVLIALDLTIFHQQKIATCSTSKSSTQIKTSVPCLSCINFQQLHNTVKATDQAFMVLGLGFVWMANQGGMEKATMENA